MNYNLGRIGVVLKGAYSAATIYETLDLVTHNGCSYIAKCATQGNSPTNTSYWEQASVPGADGREVELQKTATHIQWRLTGGTWVDLVALSEIKGDPGSQGLQGVKGDAGGVGAAGQAGTSAYQSAQTGGYTGTEAQFNADLASMAGLTSALAAL